MKYYFFWRGEGENKKPCCRSNVVNNEESDFLSNVLSDDGGIGYKSKDNIDWINEGLCGIKKVQLQEIEFFDWGRECWGAEIRKKSTKIYFLLDEDYFAEVDTNEFYDALLEWRNFILSDSDI